MKLLVVADLHYALPQFDWVVEAAPQYDAVIIAGDLLDTNSMVEPGTQILVVLKYLERLRGLTRLLVCSGNHDLDALNAAGEKHAGWLSPLRRQDIPTDGETSMLGDMLVTVCPWWDGPAARDAIGAQLEAASAQRSGQVALGLSCTAAGHAGQLGRNAAFRRSRAGGVGRAIPA